MDQKKTQEFPPSLPERKKRERSKSEGHGKSVPSGPELHFLPQTDKYEAPLRLQQSGFLLHGASISPFEPSLHQSSLLIFNSMEDSSDNSELFAQDIQPVRVQFTQQQKAHKHFLNRFDTERKTANKILLHSLTQQIITPIIFYFMIGDPTTAKICIPSLILFPLLTSMDGAKLSWHYWQNNAGIRPANFRLSQASFLASLFATITNITVALIQVMNLNQNTMLYHVMLNIQKYTLAPIFITLNLVFLYRTCVTFKADLHAFNQIEDKELKMRHCAYRRGIIINFGIDLLSNLTNLAGTVCFFLQFAIPALAVAATWQVCLCVTAVLVGLAFAKYFLFYNSIYSPNKSPEATQAKSKKQRELLHCKKINNMSHSEFRQAYLLSEVRKLLTSHNKSDCATSTFLIQLNAVILRPETFDAVGSLSAIFQDWETLLKASTIPRKLADLYLATALFLHNRRKRDVNTITMPPDFDFGIDSDKENPEELPAPETARLLAHALH